MALRIIKFSPTERIDQKMVEVEPGVWQGSRGPAFDLAVLQQYGISQVLSITTVAIPPTKGICRWWLCVDDGKPWNEEQIAFVKAFCLFCPHNRRLFLIHCDHGSSRSTGAMVIWKMVSSNMDKYQAYAYMRENNPYANCRQEILDSLPERI